jgi:ATP-dependent exoDNAse (exonuclease V) beta subunit
MDNATAKAPPPDQLQRRQALDPARSILVQAPAGSGKTTLLTERFLTLLAEVDEPSQVVAITFTIAAAAEMRNRILDELRATDPTPLARRVLERSAAADWKLLELPAQLRISTVDSFCRDLALQQPLLSGFGSGLDIAGEPRELYRRAARRTLEQLGQPNQARTSLAVEQLLEWRDNNWLELEDLLVDMLAHRDRWMQSFVLGEDPDWDALRARLETPFANAVHEGLVRVSRLLDQVPGARDEAQQLARFACGNPHGEQHRILAELAEFPVPPFATPEALEEAHQSLACLANLVLTLTHTFRKVVDKNLGFPADRKPEKTRVLQLVADLAAVPGLEAALGGVRSLPPAHYPEADWEIIRACFTLLRHAAAQLKVIFAETASVDFIEVAQIAEGVLQSDDGYPSDAAMVLADGVRHLLVDEFQDTSRRQHQLLGRLIAAWPDRAGRTLFAVGDPMQSIYFFRDADAELFARVKEIGLEIPNSEPFFLDFVPLSANFRTAPPLVNRLNGVFEQIFAVDDGSRVSFSAAEPARNGSETSDNYFKLNILFSQQTTNKSSINSGTNGVTEDPRAPQTEQILELIRQRQPAIEAARSAGKKYRIAVLARARNSLIPIAEALRAARIPFRAVELEKLAARPEVLDALALGRALLNPYDRVAWLGVLRAPWCGLSLADLHALTSADDPGLLSRPIPELLTERLDRLSADGRAASARKLRVLESAPALRAAHLAATPGTALQQLWLALGGADCCDATARANLDLLWNCLDRLPAGEPDLLSPALHGALDKLTALADPDVSSDRGVQLMTIHKSKGLEFEVVVVPDLQARTAVGSRKLLSWLERGIDPDSAAELGDPADAITEFLVAPLQSKGEDSGSAKAWVDRVYRERESQEVRRILYVAATRAREELHLFARLGCKAEANGDFSLVSPPASLLSTAWPGMEEQIHAQFEEWKAQQAAAAPETGDETGEQADLQSLAASADGAPYLVPPAAPQPRPTLLRRLPADYEPAEQRSPTAFAGPSAAGEEGDEAGDLAQTNRGAAGSAAGDGKSQLYARHEGGLATRALGTAVHTLLEELGRLRAESDWETARASLSRIEPRIAAQVRALGIPAPQAAQLASEALTLAREAADDADARWILSPHPDAASEVRWTGMAAGILTNIRVDRVFRAGETPRSDGGSTWWIVDYKTSRADASALPQLRALFAPQLAAYAQVLRGLHGAGVSIRGALYYPRIRALDWWQL